jgi:hypothetical protein
MQNRTVQEFVEDLASDGKSLNQILIIAANSRWVSHKDEIKKEYRRLKS